MDEETKLVMCGAVVTREVYEKAVKVCKDAKTDLSTVLTYLINSLANKEIEIIGAIQ